jgi:hypothetical protein
VECRQFRLRVMALCFKGKKEEGSSATDYVTDVTDGRKKEEGSSATDYVTDVTDGRKKEEGRRKFGNGLCNGCNGWKEEGRRKREEGRRKKEEGRRKKEEGRGKIIPSSHFKLKIQN